VPYRLLEGQVALITGAGQGLGRAIAREYAAEGAKVALLERNPATLDATVAELRTAGHEAQGYALDVTDYAAVGEAVSAMIGEWSKIDVLVNNAGIFRSGTILDDSLNNWRDVMAVNLEAVYMVSKLVVKHMAARGYGRVIHIASVAGTASRGNVGSYNASKGAIIAFTKSMAVELAPHGIAVNAISPGFMRTAMMQSDDGKDLTEAEDYVALYYKKRRIPMARSAEPEDVASSAVFLASDYCRYMTGQVLIVDGGLMSTF
jgi:NAD(P)-dependent dehydrogenase (short-subunit alcohol dehydrogenase family)